MRSNAAMAMRVMLLVIISVTVLFTILFLFSTSLKDVYGLVDPMVKWIPREVQLDNYSKALNAVGGGKSMLISLGLYAAVCICQVVSSAVIAYGFARYGFKGRSILFALMIASFFVPQQVLMLPRYVIFSKYGMLGTPWTLIVPSMLGQGLKHTLLILVFWQFMRTVPASLEEAAMIDGASLPGIFFRIGVPLAAPGIVISSVLSFSWNWNDTYFAGTYFKEKIRTMTLSLANMKAYYAESSGLSSSFGSKELFNKGVEAAAALIVILPLLILYVVLEKKLIESVDRAGITGE